MIGKTIFAKLFISFALTVLVAGLVTGLILFSFSHRSIQGARESFHEQRNADMARAITSVGKAAYGIYENKDSEEFARYLHGTNTSMMTELFLLVDGKSYPEGKVLPTDLNHVINSSLELGKLQLTEMNRLLFVASPLVSHDGNPYLIAGIHRIPPPPAPWQKGPPRDKKSPFHPFPGLDILIYTSVFLLIIGFVCYWLAHSFSLPIQKLRTTSRQIASGDLSARVATVKGQNQGELADLARDFNHMANRLEKLVEYQKRLLVDISHELRSPLARISVALELARQKGAENNSLMLDKVEKEVSRLNELIGRLLSLPSSKQGLENIEKTYFDLAVLVKEVVDDVSFEVEGTGKQVTIAGHLPEINFYGSREMIRQAVENILRNGVYYTAQGTSVEVSLCLQKSEENGLQKAVILVRDFGPGIPEEDLLLVFEPFYRVSVARERLQNDSGVGIGLAISNQVVQQHDGEISLMNADDGKGLLARIILPLPITYQ
ncbi:ATP-binding protein [Desulfogranum marinum]|uniref:ATP-binding protein n=1 Tax=Desulfogranum marinum TaxID=453220 RepID=UPI0029C94B5D|nr:ATP-binding protein [Desulfogranum marinum]